MRLGLAVVVLLAGLSTIQSGQQGWQPPIGIPPPPFGIQESAPSVPNPWTTPMAGFYYVDESRAESTDVSNDYGTPEHPRKTIPQTLPAGSVIELHGTYTRAHTSPNGLRINGTSSSPVFIRGSSSSERPSVTRAWEVSGTHFVLENIRFALSQAGDKLVLLAPVQRAVLRHNEVLGNKDGGGIGVYSFSTGVISEVTIFRNVIHDNGDVNASFDQDVQGIAVGSRVSYLWVLENEMSRNSGDGIQINGGRDQATTHHIYVGRNVAHHNKQNGFWTKQAVDVIFSENLSYTHRPGNSSYGACMGSQYAPERAWFLYNHMHDCEVGVGLSSDSDLGFGQYVFLIGNVIHNIHRTTPYNASAWGQSAIMMAGGVNRVVLNNTIHDVDSGIQSPGGVGSFNIANNIISAITESSGSHVHLESAGALSTSMFQHNLLAGPVRIKWGGATVYDLGRFQAAFPEKGLGTINADPRFTNPAAEGFSLLPTSPAIDAGHRESEIVYRAFRDAYGLDIARDIAGVARPQNTLWDIGAHEHLTGSGGTARPPQPPTNIRIIR